MNKLKRLALDIETNRQRLNYAHATRNVGLAERTLGLLVTLEAEYFDLTKVSIDMRQEPQYVLIFSNEYMDGKRMALTEYRTWSVDLFQRDRGDFETHVCIEIEGGAEGLADQMLMLDATDRRSIKKPA